MSQQIRNGNPNRFVLDAADLRSYHDAKLPVRVA